MTINLPNELESSIRAAVHDGRFASVDDAMAEAARLLLRDLTEKQRPRPADHETSAGLGSIGFMKDADDDLDAIVADAMRRRREETWRDVSVE